MIAFTATPKCTTITAAAHLSRELDHGRQVEAIVHSADHGDQRGPEQHAVPQLMLFAVAGGQPDQPGRERSREDRHSSEQRRLTIREAPLTRLIDRPDDSRQAHRERSQQRRHRRSRQEGIKRVELV